MATQNEETGDGQRGPLLNRAQASEFFQGKAQDLSATAAKSFGGPWKLAFFLGSLVTTCAGVIGIFGALTMFVSPFSFCNQVYLVIFGFIMIVIDFPVQIPWMLEIKLSIYRYLLFMTRFTGRGFWYLFLATMIWASLYNLDLSPFFGFIMAGFCAFLGAISIGYGIQKSLKLEKVRKAICSQGQQSIISMCPEEGMSLDAFNSLCKRYASETFSQEELSYVAAALSFSVRSDNIISGEEFRGWVQGRMTIM